MNFTMMGSRREIENRDTHRLFMGIIISMYLKKSIVEFNKEVTVGCRLPSSRKERYHSVTVEAFQSPMAKQWPRIRKAL